MNHVDPPRFTSALLGWFCGSQRHIEVEGDLIEGFAHWKKKHGGIYAHLRYWREVILFCYWCALSRFRRVFRGSTSNRRQSPDLERREGRTMFRDFRQDLHYGLRTLGKSPAFAVVTVVILALGIGANSTVFTLVNAVFFQDPPGVRAPKELVGFTRVTDQFVANSFGYPDLEFYRDYNEVFAGVAGYDGRNTAVAVGSDGDVAQATVRTVTANIFEILGIKMLHGRAFLPDEGVTPFTHPVVVLSYGFWRRHFGSDPSIVNRTVLLNGRPFTVVGVGPEEFRMISPIGEPPDLYAPVMMTGAFSPGAERELAYVDGEISYWLRVIARLRPGVDLASAQANIDVLQERWRREKAQWIEATQPNPYRIGLTSQFQLQPRTSAGLGELLRLLFLVVGVVLLIASANIAIMLLARASARQREMGIRAALGAGRARVVRQLLTESLLLASLGGAAGLAVAYWGAGLASSLFPFSLATDLKPGPTVISFTVALSAATAVLFGLAPAWQLSRRDIVSFLQRGRSYAGRTTLRQVLVVAQLAMSIVLIIGAGLFVRSLRTAQRVDLGFESERRLLLTVQLANHGYEEAEGIGFTRDMLQQIGALPGVRDVSTTTQTPFRGSWGGGMVAPGTEFAEQSVDVNFNRVGPGYFEAMGIPIVAGRAFTEADNLSAPYAVVVNEALAERLWPGENAVGKTVGRREFEATVVGVARNAMYYEVGEEPQTQLYLAQLQNYGSRITFVVATTGDPGAAARSVEHVLRARDPNLAVYNVTTLDEVVDGEIAQYRVMAILVTLFGGLALLLATVGLYGVQSYVVAQHTREIGIRMALGAMQRQVARTILGRGMVFTVVGAGIGIGVAYMLAKLVQGMLFGVNARDPLTFVTVPLILLAVAGMASVIPARRASRVDPVVALREE